MLVRLVPIGPVERYVIEHLVSEVPIYTGAKVRALQALAVPQETFNHWRKQYNAKQMLDALCKTKVGKFIDKSIPTLFVTECDLYYGGLNFTFGLEDSVLCASILSLARLRPEFYGQAANNFVLAERAVKECVHLVGHHAGLEHCRHPFCVMAFSSSVGDIDSKRKEFCIDCKIAAKLKGLDIE